MSRRQAALLQAARGVEELCRQQAAAAGESAERLESAIDWRAFAVNVRAPGAQRETAVVQYTKDGCYVWKPDGLELLGGVLGEDVLRWGGRRRS